MTKVPTTAEVRMALYGNHTNEEVEPVAPPVKPTPKITKEFLEGQIVSMPKYLFPTKRTTICIITVANGTEFIGTSTCAYEEDVDPIIGKEAAYEHAFGQMWLPYIFAMRQRIYEEGL